MSSSAVAKGFAAVLLAAGILFAFELWRVWIVVPVVLILLLPFLLFDVARLRVRKWRKASLVEAFSRQAEPGASGPPGPKFVLLLRSSDCDRGLPQRAVPGLTFEIEGQPVAVGLYTTIARAVFPLDLKAAKNPELTGDVPTVLYPDEGWKQRIRGDLLASDMIVLVPLWLSPAVAWEVRTIIELDLLHKLVIAMPSAGGYWGDPVEEAAYLQLSKRQDPLAERLLVAWRRARIDLAWLGLLVPEHESEGGLLVRSGPRAYSRRLPFHVARAELLLAAGGDPRAAMQVRANEVAWRV
jgi:hypothetical protein